MGDKKRVRWTTSVDPDLLEKMKELSGKTRIPVSRLTDEALELLLLQHKVIKIKTPKKPAPAAPEKKEAATELLQKTE